MPRSRMLVISLVLVALWYGPYQAYSATQHWVGSQSVESSAQAFILNLSMSMSGKSTVDLPDFGALDIPASKLLLSSGRIHFELIGDSSTAVFDGAVVRDVMEGSWKEGSREGRFELHLRRAAGPRLLEKPVAFSNGNVRLYGTLLTPTAKGPHPAVVFIQGAGDESRNASRFAAEFLIKHGIASLIYDKRGVGQSTGDWKTSSFEDLAKDAAAGVDYLLTQPQIAKSHIGLMGSSQGGWIAPMAALLRPDISFVIVKSAAGVTPEDEELGRTELLMHERGFSELETKEALGLYKQMINYAFTGEGWDELSLAQEKASHEKWGGYGIFPKDSWWFKFIKANFRHDPVPVLRKLNCPAMVIFGGKDPNLPVDVSVRNVDNALSASPGSLVAVFPKAGHDLRLVPMPNEPWTFSKFAPGYLDLLASWVQARTF
jgi:pimeloyl-ACP methyl ester carboxylesterase